MFSSSQKYNGMLFKHKTFERKLKHVIHMYIVKFMQANYPSGDVIFSLFDF